MQEVQQGRRVCFYGLGMVSGKSERKNRFQVTAIEIKFHRRDAENAEKISFVDF